MEFLRAQWARLQQQLAGLSPSQKMLAGALVVIMIMTLAWWGLFAGKAEMEALLDQPMTQEELGAIRARLSSQGITSKVVGDRLHVPADRRFDALAELSLSQLMPMDTRNAFDELIAKSNPFWSTKQHDAAYLQAKQTMLAQVIRRFPRVTHAMVLIDPTRERGPGGVQPSATVSMTLRPGESADQRVVEAAAELVSGAVANLDRGRIRVIVNGFSHRVKSRDETSPVANSDEFMKNLKVAEEHYVGKLARHFSFIEGTLVQVSVKLNQDRRDIVEQMYDGKNTVQKSVSDETTTEETRSSRLTPTDGGVVANSPLAVGGGAAAAPGDNNSNTNEKTKSNFIVLPSQKTTKTFNPGGDATATNASVFIPRSYFVQVYKRETGQSDKEPDEAVLQAFVSTQLAKFKQHARAALGAVAESDIVVDMYTDLMPAVGSSPAAAGTSISLLLTSHLKEIALGVLALVSLFMVTNMVKKGTPAAAMAMDSEMSAEADFPRKPKVPVVLDASEEPIGEVGEGDAALDGMELDEDAVKSQQMLGQVADMVQSDPDAAAALVKRWLNK